MQKFISLFIVILFVGVHSSNAQQNLTLNEAIKIALKNSYDVQLVSNNLAIAKNNNSLGVAGALPTIAATANDNKSLTTIQQNFADPSRNTTKSGVEGNVLTAGLTASVVLFNGYRIMAAKERLATLEVIGVNTVVETQKRFIAAEKALLECEQHLSNITVIENPVCHIQSVGKNLWLLSSKSKPSLEILIFLDEKTNIATRLNWRQNFE